MAEPLTLYTSRFSVYGRVVRMALLEMGLHVRFIDVDPFADPPDQALKDVNPMGRVPVLQEGAFTLGETSAILRFLHRRSALPFIPEDARAASRMDQVIGLIDSHGYWALVRQVSEEAVFAPLSGRDRNDARLARGLKAAAPVLRQLDAIAGEGLILRDGLSLADLHLLPMLDYFTRAAEGVALIADCPALDAYWHRMRDHPSLLATDPFVTR